MCFLEGLAETKIPDATPGVIAKYSVNDEQSLLAKLRYNRSIDIFIGLTCYSLQNHLRTTLRDGSQVETDEIYKGWKNGHTDQSILIRVRLQPSHGKIVTIEEWLKSERFMKQA